MKQNLFSLIILSFFVLNAIGKDNANDKKQDVAFGDIETEVIKSNHELQTKSGSINYQSHTGYLSIKDEQGDVLGKFFFIAYTKNNVSDPTQRPITFAFNGGPGSASVYLHLGALGPRRVKLDPKGIAGSPPYGLVDNEYSWLYETDLVFIDPIGTGYSRGLNKEKEKEFYGYKKDIKSVAKFIHRYITYYDRWASPKFVAGESYGTTRSAGLALELQKEYGVHLNGIMLVSTVLNFQTIRFSDGNDLPYVLFIPSYTASAWYHKMLPDELQRLSLDSVTQLARLFAKGEYSDALFQGNKLDEKTKLKIAASYARLTGLKKELILNANLRVNPYVFRKKLLDEKNLSIGRYDSRYTLEEFNKLKPWPDADASSNPWVKGAFNHGINDYLSRELGFTKDLQYKVFNPDIQPWEYDKNRYLDVNPELAYAMQINPYLRVHVFHGYYDLATPFFATEYTINHLNITDSRKKNISESWYLAGHMMYLKETELRKFSENAIEFIRGSIPDNVR